MSQMGVNNVVFLKILEVDEYRELFLTKLGAIYQAMTTEAMQTALDACAAMVEAEMPAHFARWAAEHEPILNNDLPTTPDDAMSYWQSRITRMRDGTMVKRPYYVYLYTQEAFSLTDEQMLTYFGSPLPAAPAD